MLNLLRVGSMEVSCRSHMHAAQWPHAISPNVQLSDRQYATDTTVNSSDCTPHTCLHCVRTRAGTTCILQYLLPCHLTGAASVQGGLGSFMQAASKSRRLTCLDVRGAVFDACAADSLAALLAKCATLRELRISAKCQQDKSLILRAASGVNSRCLLIVTTPGTDDSSENALATGASTRTCSPDLSESAGNAGHGEQLALVQLPQNSDVTARERKARRACSSVAKASLKCCKQSRQSFKQSGGLFKGSSAGGAAQRGAQVFMKADRRGVGSAKLKDLAKALKAFKVDGFSSKKVPQLVQTPCPCAIGDGRTSCSSRMQSSSEHASDNLNNTMC